MENSKQTKDLAVDIDTEKREREIQRQLEKFEKDLRKNFEKHIFTQKRSLESLLRNEFPKSNKINRQIVFSVIDTGIELPLYLFHFNVDKHFDSISFSKDLNDGMQNYLNSPQFFEVQKRIYYRLKKLGIEPCEIYCAIEPRYSMMDSKSKKRFRNNLSKWYGNKIKNQKGDKTDVISPRPKS